MRFYLKRIIWMQFSICSDDIIQFGFRIKCLILFACCSSHTYIQCLVFSTRLKAFNKTHNSIGTSILINNWKFMNKLIPEMVWYLFRWKHRQNYVSNLYYKATNVNFLCVIKKVSSNRKAHIQMKFN